MGALHGKACNGYDEPLSPTGGDLDAAFSPFPNRLRVGDDLVQATPALYPLGCQFTPVQREESLLTTPGRHQPSGEVDGRSLGFADLSSATGATRRSSIAARAAQLAASLPSSWSALGGVAAKEDDRHVQLPLQGDQERPQVVLVQSSEDFWRVQVEAIYRRRNPYKLRRVPEFLEKYKGREVILYKKVCLTYDLDPMKFYADPAAWDDKDVKDEESDANNGAAPAEDQQSVFTGVFAKAARASRLFTRELTSRASFVGASQGDASSSSRCSLAGQQMTKSATVKDTPFAFSFNEGSKVFGPLKPPGGRFPGRVYRSRRSSSLMQWAFPSNRDPTTSAGEACQTPREEQQEPQWRRAEPDVLASRRMVRAKRRMQPSDKVQDASSQPVQRAAWIPFGSVFSRAGSTDAAKRKAEAESEAGPRSKAARLHGPDGLRV